MSGPKDKIYEVGIANEITKCYKNILKIGERCGRNVEDVTAQAVDIIGKISASEYYREIMEMDNLTRSDISLETLTVLIIETMVRQAQEEKA